MQRDAAHGVEHGSVEGEVETTTGMAGEVYVEMGRLGRPYGVTGWSHVPVEL
jgi:hypothetical protein